MTDAIRGSSKKKVYERSTLLECFKSSKLISMKPQWSVSNMQAGGVGTFWTQKNHTRKIGIFTNILNSTSSCIILYQNVPLFTFYYFQELTYFGLEVSEQNYIENHKRKISIIRKAILNYVYYFELCLYYV